MMAQIQYAEFLDKIRGCWAGKNIGGTLGAPMEGRMEMNDVTFYTQELHGVPAPNDDLDLQLVWLAAVEVYGLDGITPRRLGEYWDQAIIAPCSEYAVCKMNVANGIMPPLSGAVNNDRFKYSNGAWIRSEIWACLCPGAPDEAIRYAYMDSCADHCEEGIWAEMFTVALQSAAFVENDMHKLIEIALSKVPAESRLAAAVRCVVDGYDRHLPWQTVRGMLLERFAVEQYRAAVNIGFVIIGLLYGEGDFDRSVCLAVNCGDDTDCTGATVGALFGILRGRSGIPSRWLEPIGEGISTICINHFGFVFLYGLPQTLEALSLRTARTAVAAAGGNPYLLRITDAPTSLPPDHTEKMLGSDEARRYWSMPLFCMDFPLSYAVLRVEYPDGIEAAPGSSLKMIFTVGDSIHVNAVIGLRWRNLPEGWSGDPAALEFSLRADSCNAVSMTLNVGEFPDTMAYPELEVSLRGRRVPEILLIPVQRAGTVFYTRGKEGELAYRCRRRMEAAKACGFTLENNTPQI